jgi:RimJ/RimL family protein N-acetyltransferase
MTAAPVAPRRRYGDRGRDVRLRGGRGVCGFAALEPEPREEGCAVMGVWLQPSARQKVIGRELALMALEFARNAGYGKVRGTLPAGNEAALAFFSEIGALAQVVGGGMQYELPL